MERKSRTDARDSDRRLTACFVSESKNQQVQDELKTRPRWDGMDIKWVG